VGVTIFEGESDSDNGIAGLGSLFAGVVEGLVDCGNVLVGDVLAGGCVDEDVVGDGFRVRNVLVNGLYEADDLGVLTSSARLFLVDISELLLLGHSLPVVYLRRTNLQVDLVLSTHSFGVYLQMQLAHAGN